MFSKRNVCSSSAIMNRTLAAKDTFVSLFPAYGVAEDNAQPHQKEKFVYEEFDPAENRRTALPDKRNYKRWDDMKKYTEEWLKNVNMIGKK